MLSSITPLGERGRASRWPVTATAYLLGSALGGTAVGTLLGTAGSLLPWRSGALTGLALALLAALAVLTVASEAGRVRVPSWHRQVDEDWLHRYRGWVYGLGYGAQLGVGVVTIVTSPVLHLALACMLLSADPAAGAVLGLVFGLVRALPLLAARRVTTAARLARLHRDIERLAPAGRRLTGSWAATVGLLALTGLTLGGLT